MKYLFIISGKKNNQHHFQNAKDLSSISLYPIYRSIEIITLILFRTVIQKKIIFGYLKYFQSSHLRYWLPHLTNPSHYTRACEKSCPLRKRQNPLHLPDPQLALLIPRCNELRWPSPLIGHCCLARGKHFLYRTSKIMNCIIVVRS